MQGDLSVLLTRGSGEPAPGPIELHYTRAAVDPEDVRFAGKPATFASSRPDTELHKLLASPQV